MLKILSTLKDEIPEDSVIEKVYMPLLSKNETKEYIEKRLCSTGYTGNSPFSARETNLIFEASGGIPGEINKYAAGILEKALSRSNKMVSLFKKIIKS